MDCTTDASSLADMFDIGPEKLLLILGIALVFLGPRKLPDIARSLGKGLREFRHASSGIRDELTADGPGRPADPPSSADGTAPRSEGSEGSSPVDSRPVGRDEEEHRA